MDPKLVKAALEALKNEDGDAALALLEQALAAAAGGDAVAEGGDAPADAGATAENADTPPPDPNAPPADDKQKQEMAALSRELVTLSGRDAGAALAYFRGLHEVAARTAEDSALLEAGERRELVAELVKLGVEVPGTAWKRDEAGNIPEGDKREPVARLAGEPIADLRSRVTVMRATRGKTTATPVTAGGNAPAPRGGPAAGPATKPLSKAELAYCEREKITPDEFRARAASAVKRSK